MFLKKGIQGVSNTFSDKKFFPGFICMAKTMDELFG